MQDPRQQQWLLQPGGIAARLRELQGKTSGVAFAEKVGMRPSKVSKLRLGQQLPTEEDLRAWVTAAGERKAVADELVAMLAEADRHHSGFERRLKRGQKKHQEDYNELVEQANVIRMFERSFIPRLLQTYDYARARLLRSAQRHKTTADDVEAATVARIDCQKYLRDGKHRFEFIIDGVVLTRGPATIMLGQMDRLLEAIDLPSVRLGIIPTHGEPENDLINSFELYEKVGIVETYYDGEPQSDEARAKYDETMQALWADAVEGDEARALIRKAREYHVSQLQAEGQ